MYTFDYVFINKISVFIIVILGLGIGFWTYLSNRKNKLNQVFFIFSIFLVLWTSYPFFFNLPGISHRLSLLLVRLAYGTVALFFIPFYFFIKLLIQEYKKYWFLDRFIIFAGTALFAFSTFTNLHIVNIKIEEWGVSPIFGVGKIVYFGIISSLIFPIVWLLLTNYFNLSPKERLKTQYILIGLFLFILLNSIFNIFFPLWKDSLKYYPLGNYSAIFLIGFTAFAIVKRNLFGMRVVLTGLLVGSIAISLLLDIFVFTPQLLIQLFKGLILIIFLYFGYLLIKNIIGEIKRREELERITGELEVANVKLDSAYKSLEKLDKAKSEFISIASHQLKTPLTAIKGYTSMVLEGSYGKLPQKAKAPIENVFKSALRLIKLVNDLLSLSRLESGKIELDIQETPIEEIIPDILKELALEAEKKNIYLKWDPKKQLPRVMADKDKIREVIFNIIDNAIKYTNQGGITITSETGNNYAKIVIADTGEGMSKEELGKIFMSFSRGGAGNQFYTEGVGLGLYIAKRFVDLHKGRVWAESEGKGRGSTFYIELPIK
ncbi:MAG: HAMP domain-containing sensor histidine kinase [Candidatus Wildermuthbacteria bacterium]|nr:HAMP domain-containing sensor histidine kinase [Candidatus Wildermuthbacteria bacterium]